MAYELLPGTRAPVKMWTDPAAVDAAALQQLRNVASLSWTQQVAVIPTCVLDEIPGAYKDIADVIARQTDLVEVVHHLEQVVCVKG